MSQHKQFGHHSHGNAFGAVQVIGLQSTGEANSEAVREAHGAVADDLISAPRIAMQQFIERNFPLCANELDASQLSTLEFQVMATSHAAELLSMLVICRTQSLTPTTYTAPKCRPVSSYGRLMSQLILPMTSVNCRILQHGGLLVKASCHSQLHPGKQIHSMHSSVSLQLSMLVPKPQCACQRRGCHSSLPKACCLSAVLLLFGFRFAVLISQVARVQLPRSSLFKSCTTCPGVA